MIRRKWAVLPVGARVFVAYLVFAFAWLLILPIPAWFAAWSDVQNDYCFAVESYNATVRLRDEYPAKNGQNQPPWMQYLHTEVPAPPSFTDAIVGAFAPQRLVRAMGMCLYPILLSFIGLNLFLLLTPRPKQREDASLRQPI